MPTSTLEHTPRSPDALLDEVYRRADRRQRQRRTRSVLLVATVAVAVVLAAFGLAGSGSPSHEQVTTTDTLAPGDRLPADLVTVEDGLVVASTATGRVLRTLVPSGTGVGMVDPQLSPDRSTVYFIAQGPEGTVDRIESVPFRGGEVRQLVAGARDGEIAGYSVSPDGTRVAWVDDARPSGGTLSLQLTRVADQVTTPVAVPDVPAAANPSWSPAGDQLALGTGSGEGAFHVAVLSIPRSGTAVLKASVAAVCSERWPRFVGPHELAAAQYCGLSAAGSDSLPTSIVVFDSRTGAARRVAVHAAPNHRIMSFTSDATGTHPLWIDVSLLGNRTIRLVTTRDGATVTLPSGLDLVQPAW
jgi:dipeptidyl aminopeptidase/acylaminoacyl peptidase